MFNGYDHVTIIINVFTSFIVCISLSKERRRQRKKNGLAMTMRGKENHIKGLMALARKRNIWSEVVRRLAA